MEEKIKIIRPRDPMIMRLYERKLLGSHMYCGGGNMFSIFHATSRDHMLKGFCDFMREYKFTLYKQLVKVFG